MRTVYVIGIGSGDPEHLTLAAIAAMNRVDVFFTIDKGEVKSDLAALRAELLARHVNGLFRVVEAPDPQRDRAAERYEAAVGSWQGEREALYERMLTEELAEGESGGFLVWGDPALYDGTLPILERIRARRPGVEIVSVPGISSVQALAAAHRLVLNRVGRAFTVTTGRRLAASGMPADVDDVVVMLDSRTAFAELTDPDVDIFWGAYVGSSDETLLHGDLQAMKGTIKEVRAELRERKGWIMDTYLLRRRDPR
ncbi:precorrin-6A synthase (deacetylating) [Pseudonocardia sp. TRM90224]|uniref:precorrin-6A synthase (deacetylating) n=1 Tax=Pseudonocardia sp. TRM90224 TaxID=2812678 RepID=UPI001E5BFB97|nr:precorrin-6A synthase (deacetylating) [Pseudonocardia sp. TRM90224]